MIIYHLPILQIIIPLIAAPIVILIRSAYWSWLFSLLVTWISFFISITLLVKVITDGVVLYSLGGWDAPWGIEYRIDILNGFVLVIVSAIGAVVMPYAKISIQFEISKDRIYLFYSMLLLCLTGLLGITITGDAFNLFVFLEISSLSSYVLISMGKDKRSLTAAYRYLIMGTIGATFYVIGVGLMYMMTGTLNIYDLAQIMPTISSSRTIQAALAFLTVGLCLKIALFPLHMWLPSSYAYAPSVVTIFLAATATKVSVYALIRVVFTIFGGIDLLGTLVVRDFLLVLSVIGMIAASFVAIYQENIKRLLAYSSVAQVGYIILGISINNTTSIAAGIIHLFNHALIKGGLFMVMGIIMYQIGSVRLGNLAGLGKKIPLTMACFVAGGFALIGIPLSTGFISKWYLIQGAIEEDWWPLSIVIGFTSLLAVVYIWKIVEVAYFQQPVEKDCVIKRAPISMVLPMILLIAASYYFGIDSKLTMKIALSAADTLMSISE